MPAPIIAAAAKTALKKLAVRYAKRKAVDKAAQKLTGRGQNGGSGAWWKILLIVGVLGIVGMIAIPVGLVAMLTPQGNPGGNKKDDGSGCQTTQTVTQVGAGGNPGDQPDTYSGGDPQQDPPAPNPGKGGKSIPAGETIDTLSPRQIANIRTILGTAKAVGANRQASVIALMTVSVETDFRLLASDINGMDESMKYPHDAVAGDNTSVGFFQTLNEAGPIADRMNPVTDTKNFFLGWPQKGWKVPGLFDIKGWETMPLGVAAQRVQVSAYPDRYAQKEALANQIYDKFVNVSPVPQGIEAVAGAEQIRDTAAAAPVNCGPAGYGMGGDLDCPPNPVVEKMLGAVQPDTLRTSLCVARKFPMIKIYGGVREDSMPYHPSGRAVDIMNSSAFPDINSPDAVANGDQMAAYIWDRRQEFGVDHIIWRQRIISTARESEGWRDMPDRGGATQNHMDHVHVTTFGNAGARFYDEALKRQSAEQAMGGKSGPVTSPIAPGRFVFTARWREVGSWARWHTGLDFAAPIGTPIVAAADGIVQPPMGIWQAGTHVVIKHGDGSSTVYWHMNNATVRPGDIVKAGQLIGSVGLTGRTFGEHLHFEYYPPGVTAGDLYNTQDPYAWLRAGGAKI